jgi:hypothetical protein
MTPWLARQLSWLCTDIRLFFHTALTREAAPGIANDFNRLALQPDWQASKPAQGVLVVGGVLFDLAKKFGVLARIFFE